MPLPRKEHKMTKQTQSEKLINHYKKQVAIRDKHLGKVNEKEDLKMRHCFTVVSDSELENNYRVAKVIENESGYYPLGKSKVDNWELDKFVSDDKEHIQRICDQFNKPLNLTQQDIDDIIFSSVRKQFEPWYKPE